MLFNSYNFLVFFLVVTTIYFLLPHKLRWLHLLVASCYFYMAFVPIYILILFFTIIVDYVAGIMIEGADGSRRRWFLIMSLVANVGILAVFKYYNFFIENVNLLFHSANSAISIPLLKIILPIGLSFHTFQAMSYTIEVYRGNQKAERHFGIYALYVMFYPQLVAGPIERPQNILHQFHQKHEFSVENVTSGLKMMLWGFFKKIVIADRLAMVVNEVYKSPSHFIGLPVCIALVFFAFQIYCDFSGYSDIAIGAAKIMGFDLMTNFNNPYAAESISEFWTRWHISLSTWFKDYLYIPLGGSRKGKFNWYRNLFIVFMISGLWHGANWTFIIWGALHAVYSISGLIMKSPSEKFSQSIGLNNFTALKTFINRTIVFILVTFAWIFFRAKNIREALCVIKNFFSGWGKTFSSSQIKLMITELGGGKLIDGFFNVAIGIMLILFLQYVQQQTKNKKPMDWLDGKPTVIRWSFYYSLIISILVFGAFNNAEFIYFQF